MKQLWEIFWSFFKIGLFTFGGGYAMIPLIQREVIDHRKWIPASEFLDLNEDFETPIAFFRYDRCVRMKLLPRNRCFFQIIINFAMM